MVGNKGWRAIQHENEPGLHDDGTRWSWELLLLLFLPSILFVMQHSLRRKKERKKKPLHTQPHSPCDDHHSEPQGSWRREIWAVEVKF